MKRAPVISIIGRPNVGKSTLFNRLMKKATKAITFDKPGVTRDRHYGITKFDDLGDEDEVDAILVDTGGFYPERIEEASNKQDSKKNYLESAHNKFFNLMSDHAELSIDESDLILLVVDVREGLIPFDENIANVIRTKKKKFWLVVNKFDSDKQEGHEAEFYNLGIESEDMFITSSTHGRGIDDLRTRIHEELLFMHQEGITKDASNIQKGVTPKEEVIARVALIGAPNAGKSTMLNKLLGSQRALVSDIAGTTVDPIEGFFDLYFGKDVEKLGKDKLPKSNKLLLEQYDQFRVNNPDVFAAINDSYVLEDIETQQEAVASTADDFDKTVDDLTKKVFNDMDDSAEDTSKENFWRSIHLVDTAGIRRKNQVEGFIESQSVYRSLRCITESDIVVFMVDATKGIGHQDRRLLDIAFEKGKSIIIALNKIDLLKDKLQTDHDRREWILDLRYTIPWLEFCDLIPLSAKHGKGINRLKKALKKTIIIRRRVIPTGLLNRSVLDIVDRHPVVVAKSGGKRLKVKYASMVQTSPPTFLLFTNKSKGIPENYKRYLKNSIRREFRIENTPIHLLFRTGKDLEIRKVERKK